MESRGHAYTAPARLIAGTLVAASRAGLLAVLVGAVAADDPVSPFTLARGLVTFAAVPALASWLLGRVSAVRISVDAGALVFARRDWHVEIPCAAVAGVVPWTLPPPAPGFSLQMRSGSPFPYGIASSAAVPLLRALLEVGQVDAARAALTHPTLLYAEARRTVAGRRWWAPLGKFVAFALLPTALVFNADQHITFGGTLGQYYLEGLGPYLRRFAMYWALAVIYLLLYAAVWRALAEGVAFLAARIAPSQAATVRSAVEIGCRLVYYVGIPVIVLMPFLR